MAGGNDADDLLISFERLSITTNNTKHRVETSEAVHEVDKKEEPYFVHIDISCNSDRSRNKAARWINSYMLRKYYFDPRRYHNFLDDVFMNEDETPGHPTLAQMRSAMQASEKYYELWKVRGDFDLAAFYEHFVRGNFDNLCIHVTQLFEDGEYTLTRKQY